MANSLKAPGVYIDEITALPSPIVSVPSSVPVFIGYTQKADKDAQSLTGVPVRISSLLEFERLFGPGPEPLLSFEGISTAGRAEPVVDLLAGSYTLRRVTPAFRLFQNLVLYFLNGGGPCYIVSVGFHDDVPDAATLIAGVNGLENEAEPSLVLVPDAVSLDSLAECVTVQQAVLAHCAGSGSRFAILDVYDGYRSRSQGVDCIAEYRGALGSNHLDYGAAYYPWLYSTSPTYSVPTFRNLDSRSRSALAKVIAKESGVTEAVASGADVDTDTRKTQALLNILTGRDEPELSPTEPEWSDENVDEALRKCSSAYRQFVRQGSEFLSLTPPGGAVAGLYVSVDTGRGVWQSPANVSLNGIARPAVSISDDDQQDLNVSPQGKSINAIRTFAGRGILVWGGRTLDGNDNQWRYISVRRTTIMVEKSIRRAGKAYVFSPNDVRTWTAMKAVISRFLDDIWKQGGLRGSKPEHAYAVKLGLGETMTEQDVLQGRLRIQVMMALLRPAEFIVIEIALQMEGS